MTPSVITGFISLAITILGVTVKFVYDYSVCKTQLADVKQEVSELQNFRFDMTSKIAQMTESLRAIKETNERIEKKLEKIMER